MTDIQPTAVILVGPPGSGKTACGLQLARALGWLFVDTDRAIEEQTGSSIESIFRDKGEPHFRELESAFIVELSACARSEAAAGSGLIVGTGGGMPVFDNNMEKLKSLGAVVYLTASLPALVDRVASQGGRPLLPTAFVEEKDGATQGLSERLENLVGIRSGVYEQAHYRIDTTDCTAEEAATQIMALLGLPAPGSHACSKGDRND